MSGQQQAAEAEPTTLGYCLQCGGYGRGEYVGPINSHSDAISEHRGCARLSPNETTETGPATGD